MGLEWDMSLALRLAGSVDKRFESFVKKGAVYLESCDDDNNV